MATNLCVPSFGGVRHKPLAAALAVILATGAISLPHVATAATVTVSNCDDDGAGSLRAAASSVSSGDTVDLTSLECSIITLVSGEIGIGVEDVAFVGPGKDKLTIDGDNNSRVFNFAGTGTLSIQGMMLTYGSHETYGSDAHGGAIMASGDVVLEDMAITYSWAYSDANARGGAVYANGDVTLTNSVIYYNEARSQQNASGGAVHAGGDVTLTDSVINANFATAEYDAYGGGVFTDEQTITSYGSTISDNEAFGNKAKGGGLHSGTIVLQGSTVSHNLASGGDDASGGGIEAKQRDSSPKYRGHVEVRDSTIAGNRSSSDGGGISTATLTLVNSTLSSNLALGNGGGATVSEDVDIRNSTIAYNSAGDVAGGLWTGPTKEAIIVSSILFGNLSGKTTQARDLYIRSVFGSVKLNPASANNIIGSANVTLPVDTIQANPLLGLLQYNGGPTKTHAIGPDSPAIDSGNNDSSLVTDQRGVSFPRVVGVYADIGAFEYSDDVIFINGFD